MSEGARAELLVNKWQKILRLQYLQVFVYVKSLRDLPDDYRDCYGFCQPNISSKQAVITIRSEIDHDDQPLPFDIEQVIVHELLHLYTADMSVLETPGSFEYIAMEQMIELLSWAFITLDRKNGLNG